MASAAKVSAAVPQSANEHMAQSAPRDPMNYELLSPPILGHKANECNLIATIRRRSRVCEQKNRTEIKKATPFGGSPERSAPSLRAVAQTATTGVAVQVPEPEMVTPPPRLVDGMVHVPFRTLP